MVYIFMCTSTNTLSAHMMCLETSIYTHAHVCSHIRYVMLSLVTKKIRNVFIPKNLI